MADIDGDTDRLLRELGIGGGSGSAAASVSVSVKTSSSGPPAPPPPPPPPPPSASASSGPVVKLKVKPAQQAQKEIDDIFDSVISFAGKTSNKKKTPPPVAPKPKRKVHVSSYTMQVKSPTSKAPPTKNVAAVSVPPPAPSPAPVSVGVAASVKKPSESGGIVPVEQQPVALVAFGPGLETFEVNSYGHFQVSCPHDTYEEDLEISAVGPTGSKPVEIDDNGNGQFSCSYVPTSAGPHTVTIKVNGKHIPGSPFTANVQFAAYTDKCSASGPGLVSGTTDEPCRFVVKCKEEAGHARLRVHILGPSKAEPIEMVEDADDRIINVTYHPSASGDYTLRVLWGEAHVHGSPFNVLVTGENINDPSRVKVTGDGLKGGNVDEPLKFFVEGESGAGPGPLGVRIVGPSKPEITADDSSDEGVEVTFSCRDPGEYQLVLKWGNEEVPNSPYSFTIAGEGREIKPELCKASGSGMERGVVGEAVSFVVEVPDEAGPGALSVTAYGPHPPKPIEVVNNQDGTMSITYHPIAPGEYKLEVFWADLHISGSPFTAQITGQAVRNAKLVSASGDALSEEGIKCNQLGTILVQPREGAGPGPLRAKLQGPSKADLQLTNNQDGTMLVSFVTKDPGTYSLHLLWGDGEDEEHEISGSPFSIKVEN